MPRRERPASPPLATRRRLRGGHRPARRPPWSTAEAGFVPLRPPSELRPSIRPPALVLALVALLAALPAGRAAAAETPADAAPADRCAGDPAAAAELTAIGRDRGDCMPGHPCQQAIGERLAALAAAHPGDVTVQRAWQDHALHRRGDDREAALAPLRERFAARLAAHPDDPAAHYLAARLAEGDAERAGYERALALDPAFPWPHLGLAVLRGRGREVPEADAEAARGHLAAFLAACPGRFQEMLANAPHLGGVDFWRPHAPALRGALAAAEPGEQAAWLRRLWELEMAVVSPAEHDAVRRRIRADVERLEAAGLAADPRWWQARVDGWERAGDTARRDAAIAGAAAAFPCSRQAEDLFQERIAELAGEEPVILSASVVPAEHRGEVERLAREALAGCPDGFVFASVLLRALEGRDDLAPDERRRELAEIVRVWEVNRQRVRMSETPYARVARELLRRGLDPAWAAELARREIATTGESDPAAAPPPGMPADLARRHRLGRVVQQAKNRALLAEALAAGGDTAAAAEELARAETLLLAVEEPEMEPPERLPLTAQRRRLAALRARLAEAEGRTADAFALHLAAVPPEPAPGEGAPPGGGPTAAGDPAAGDSAAETSAAAAARLWAALGGSPGTLALLRDAGPAAAPPAPAEPPGAWQARDEPLADFALADLAGRTWRLADFAGKTLLVNLWATWCVPCRWELPHVEALHRRLAGREDVAVVTFNTDREIGLVAPYLAEEGFTFPVLLAAEHVERTQGGTSIPQTWIVDAAGRLRHFQRGFSPQLAEGWADAALALLEETAGGAGGAREDGR